MGLGEPKTPTPDGLAKIQKIKNRAAEIALNVPKTQLPQIIQELKWYLEYRKKEDEAQKYPSNLDLGADALAMIDEDYELWNSLHEIYGWTPDNNTPKWTSSELADLIKTLESR